MLLWLKGALERRPWASHLGEVVSPRSYSTVRAERHLPGSTRGGSRVSTITGHDPSPRRLRGHSPLRSLFCRPASARYTRNGTGCKVPAAAVLIPKNGLNPSLGLC